MRMYRCDRCGELVTASYVGDSFLINVELPEGYAMTLPIGYCPMCGERLEGDWDDER